MWSTEKVVSLMFRKAELLQLQGMGMLNETKFIKFCQFSLREQKLRVGAPVCKYTMRTTRRRRRICKLKGEEKN